MLMTKSDFDSQIMKILNENPEMIMTFKAKYVTEGMWDYCISRNPQLFRECKDPTPKLCYRVLSMDGFFLEDIDPSKYSKEIYTRMCWIALETTPKAFPLIPEKYRTKEMKTYAYSMDPELLLSEKRLTPAMLEEIIDHRPDLIRYVANPTDDLIIRALEKEPKAIVYFTSISDRVRTWYEEHFPEYASMLFLG